MQMRTANYKYQGFTLVELMVVLAVAAIIATVAIPSYKTLIQNNRNTTQINTFLGALNFARSEAIKRAVPIVICKSSNKTNCQTSGVDWEDGWIVFANSDNDSPPIVDSGEQIIRLYSQIDGENTLRGSTNVADFTSFTSRGVANTSGTFILCDDRGANYAKAATIAVTGRVRVATKQIDGSALSCP